MKVDTRDITETRKQIVVSFEAEEVDAELQRVIAEFNLHGRIPGFRPGKAPPAVVQRRYQKEISGELTKAIVTRAYRNGIEESKLDVLTVIDVAEPAVSAGNPVEISVTVDINPKFDLPEFKAIPITAGDLSVKAEEVDGVIENIRRERADFKTVERAAAEGDYVKFGFEGRIGDEKIADLVPERPIYGTMPHTWEEAGSEEGLLPGMGKHLIGLAAGEEREATIDFPKGFQIENLAGKSGTYQVKVEEVRERVLPELDEEFLKAQNVTTAEELREQVEKSLKSRKESEDLSNRRQQIAAALASRIDFPIPESLIDSEADSLIRQIVEQNMRRGIPQEELEKNKDELFASARKNAIERTKMRMILLRIAEAEKLEVANEDINRALIGEAMRANERPEKIVKELEKDKGRLRALQQNVLVDKTLDFLVEQATVSPA